MIVILQDGSCIGSNSGPEFGTLLGNGSRDCATLHFSLVVDNDTGAVLKVNEDTLLPAERLALPHNDSGHDLLSQFWLSLFDRAHDHVSGTRLWESVKTSTDIADGNDVKVFSAGVVGAVDYGGIWETRRNSVLDAGGKSPSALPFFTHF
jgi:hypothetical protein